jgi:hypothetical protein
MLSGASFSRAGVLLWAAVLVGCGESQTTFATEPEPPAPVVVIPPGIVSSRTADEVPRLMLDEIATSERRLGRALAPARIVRIQLLRPGEMYEARHFDGTNPGGVGMSPDGGPGWRERLATAPGSARCDRR